jgi:AraC-like DNA-binding protein
VGLGRALAEIGCLRFKSGLVEVTGLLSNSQLGQKLSQLLHGPDVKVPEELQVQALPALPHHQIRLAAVEVERLVDDYRRRKPPLEELAAEFGVHRQTAARHLDQAGVGLRRKVLSEAQIAEAVQLYREGWSLAKIGSHLGVNPVSVSYRLKQAGVKLRPRPGY